ncbi:MULTISPECIES: exodeoxyribonuclease VII large subunit [Tissierellales]|jgi:exodeoxyribonuclease VII large subunit|uniref:Exodeoxyribonuclease 7 large subunit n=1 Tax=Acidilutibacter cellobiosedens TaxID=2507161 RepID=A0A410QCL1_9FIRM|nr:MULTISPECIES: exodeoxyribonuclease VII large subunit [Tissierellales]QAT61763.1 exodeoxyribonuclease VII large subunit [Acidilutibacter cellobiosedens]SCL82355.1 Exodeoxyribonuclease 7 large subunit [Sporanaerobacter sp. PP17-6a]
MDIKPLKVSEINFYIKRLFQGDPILCNVCVEGEISNFKHHYSGHMYFSLKDESGKLKCVMFKNDNQSLNFSLEDGMKVIALGYISVYERDGDYQLYVRNIKKNGIGELYEAFENLKLKLEKEGLFNIENKKAIPAFPKKIGIVTSSTGAAIKDILNVIKRRFPIADIIIYPSLVQGENAASNVIEGLKYLDSRNDIDLIIMGRGGGSYEELFSFNDENLARIIYNLNTPVISAVGHERDFTIADFVSDLRAPTPSAGAELAVPKLSLLKEDLENSYKSLKSNFLSVMKGNFVQMEYMGKRLKNSNPANVINDDKQYLDGIFKHLNILFTAKYKEEKNKLDLYKHKLNVLSPLSSIKRGYGVIYDDKGMVVKSVEEIKVGDNFNVLLKDGMIKGKVAKIQKGVLKNEFK